MGREVVVAGEGALAVGGGPGRVLRGVVVGRGPARVRRGVVIGGGGAGCRGGAGW